MHQTCTSTKTKTKILATTQIYNFAFVFCGACAGLVHLCRFCDSDLARHLQAPTKTSKKQSSTFIRPTITRTSIYWQHLFGEWQFATAAWLQAKNLPTRLCKIRYRTTNQKCVQRLKNYTWYSPYFIYWYACLITATSPWVQARSSMFGSWQ